MAKNKKVRKFSKFANNQMDFILLITVILLLYQLVHLHHFQKQVMIVMYILKSKPFLL